MELIIKALGELESKQLTTDDISTLLDLPNLIPSCAPFFPQVITSVCDKWLWQFGTYEGIPSSLSREFRITNQDVVQWFCSLPFTAVSGWLEHATIAKGSPSSNPSSHMMHFDCTCIVFLTAAWVLKHSEQQSASAKDVRNADELIAQFSMCEAKQLFPVEHRHSFSIIGFTNMLDFTKVGERWLLIYFDDVQRVIQKQSPHNSFLALSYEMVRAWASLDELACHENDVAVLLTFWCTKNKREYSYSYSTYNIISDDQIHEQLSSLLRVSALSRSFRYMQLPRLSWFKPRRFQDLSCFNLMLEDDDQEAHSDPCSWMTSLNPYTQKFPQSWYKKPRTGCPHFDASQDAAADAAIAADEGDDVISHNFTKADFEAGLLVAEKEDADKKISTPGNNKYHGGYFWKLSLCVVDGSNLAVSLLPATNVAFSYPQGIKVQFYMGFRIGDSKENKTTATLSHWFHEVSEKKIVFRAGVKSIQDVEDLMDDGAFKLYCKFVEVQ